MIADLLPALQAALVEALADLSLTQHQRGHNRERQLAHPGGRQQEAHPGGHPQGHEMPPAPGTAVPGTVQVFIGDLPPRSGQDSVFPAVILTPIAGWGEGGEVFEDVAFLAGVYNNEDGDAQGAEAELALLRSRLTRFLREALDVPVASRFTCVRDEKGRYMRWQRQDPLGQPRPFAQVAIISRWSLPGWE
ncbi:hypothetical protein [Megalodesulfovibrio paquesii]